jgi:hypothetical protein
MGTWKLFLATAVLAICGTVCNTPLASAQVRAYYSVGYGVPVYGPSPIPYAPPIVVARPIVVAPVPVQVVTAYSPVVPTYIAPAAVYSTYRPVYPVAPAPIYVPPAYGTVARYRSGYIGPGLGGAPSVYTPGQPVRNAIRYVVP